MQFSNPRLVAQFVDWPIGGANRGQCEFNIEHDAKRGYRINRKTTDKYGKWCKPKTTTYGGKVAIVDGDDGRTYALQLSCYGHIHIWRSDFKQSNSVFGDTNPERYEELKAIILSCYKE